MAVTDPIADYLTRIRNAAMARHRVVEIPYSNMKKSMTEILYAQGYIHRYKIDTEVGPQGVITIALKYNGKNEPVIKKMGRISRPGLRQYAGSNDIPRILNNLGICIVSTSKGVMTGKEAKASKVGGEVLCYVY
jgi:small subunit ribosomal protein S8